MPRKPTYKVVGGKGTQWPPAVLAYSKHYRQHIYLGRIDKISDRKTFGIWRSKFSPFRRKW